MFGINEARRRKMMAEESAFDYANRVTRKEPKQNIYSGSFLSMDNLKEKQKEYKQKIEEKRIVDKAEAKIKKEVQERRTAKFAPYEKALGSVFSYRPNKPSKFKTKAVKGIYSSPFKR